MSNFMKSSSFNWQYFANNAIVYRWKVIQSVEKMERTSNQFLDIFPNFSVSFF